MLNPNLSIKQAVRVCLALILILAGLFISLHYIDQPPAETKLIARFYAHRVTYEQLRDMLQTDTQVLTVANWGIETTKSVAIIIPPEDNFPITRYHEYLALLKEVDAVGVFRERKQGSAEISIDVWASGFGGDTRHVNICWLEHVPRNQVPSLDSYYKTPKPHSPVVRHIEDNWYLCADW
ncbi:MAG TPA: hypothetical protein VKT33_05810 [Candidatus Angelobacter sp.]|nr:hypothetical protein [Candidatus Angelobacter sp.]